MDIQPSELTVTIDGTDVIIGKNSFKAEDELESRAVCKFTVIDKYDEHQLNRGQPVSIYDDKSHVFSGYIWTADESPLGPKGFEWQIKCVDMTYLATKRVIAYVNQNINAGDVVKDIIDRKLAKEGVTYTEDSIFDGPELSEVAFNYVNCNEALNAVAERAGFWYKIDKDKVLHFKPRTEDSAPYNIENRKLFIGQPEVRFGNPDYRNRQYIKGGRAITDEQTETKKGDGESQSFGVGFPIAEKSTIEVDIGSDGVWESQTVGRKGEDDDKQWYWDKNDNTVTQDRDETVLSENDKLRIKYRGFYRIIAVGDNKSEIKRQKNIESDTSGIIEHVERRSDFVGRDTAEEVVNSKLEKYAKESTKLSYKTPKAGLQAGMLQRVDLPEYNIENERLLITKVTAKRKDIFTFFEVEAVKGPKHENWGDFFKKLSAKAEQEVRLGVEPDETVVILQNLSSDIPISETFEKVNEDVLIESDLILTETFEKVNEDVFLEAEDIKLSDFMEDIEKAEPESRVGYAKVGYSEVK